MRDKFSVEASAPFEFIDHSNFSKDKYRGFHRSESVSFSAMERQYHRVGTDNKEVKNTVRKRMHPNGISHHMHLLQSMDMNRKLLTKNSVLPVRERVVGMTFCRREGEIGILHVHYGYLEHSAASK